jgi:Domain of unknown function (DUF6531)
MQLVDRFVRQFRSVARMWRFAGCRSQAIARGCWSRPLRQVVACLVSIVLLTSLVVIEQAKPSSAATHAPVCSFTGSVTQQVGGYTDIGVACSIGLPFGADLTGMTIYIHWETGYPNGAWIGPGVPVTDRLTTVNTETVLLYKMHTQWSVYTYPSPATFETFTGSISGNGYSGGFQGGNTCSTANYSLALVCPPSNIVVPQTPFTQSFTKLNTFAADPVNTSTGVFTDRQSDLVSPPGTSGLSYDRFYNSSDRRTGSHGLGWVGSFNDRLTTDPLGRVVFAESSGRVSTFTPNGSGGWVHPTGVEAQVLTRPDTSLALSYTDGTVWEFDLAGMLESKTFWAASIRRIVR